MSGIAGLLSLDGKPIDPLLLGRLTDAMRFRGPDGQATWAGGRVGFAHAMLRTTFESLDERQPCSFDERVWIVADARVDGRAELCRELRAAGRDCPQSASDAEMILHAYHAWGDDCVRHLLGDFVFAIWDAGRERLFCARDHFGVKPFFYARADDCVVFGNTLGCVRQHPRVSDALNDLAIADFLLFGSNQDPATTAFADIRRLPPAHRLSWSQSGLRVECYWTLPAGGHLSCSEVGDPVGDFTERLNAAVADRLRDNRIGVLMGGGLDSTSIAVTARAQLRERQEQFDLRAYTCVYDRLFADEERQYARLAADALGIPVHYLVADDYALFERCRAAGLQLPEPAVEPLVALYLDQARQIASHCRVVLTGWDGDALLNEGVNAPGGIINETVRLARRAASAGWRALSRARLLWPGLSERRTRMQSGRNETAFTCPEWLHPDLVESLELPARRREQQESVRERGWRRPEAHRVLESPLLTNLLESYDPGVTRVLVEARHPLLDLRVVEFLMSLPASPWCVEKKLLRTAMRGRLPEPVRLRSKTPLAGDPVIELLQRADARWIDDFQAVPALDRFVDRTAIPPLAGPCNHDRVWTHLRPLCLNLWLKQLPASTRESSREDYHEVA